jgi:hypothetical protein
MTRPSAQPTDPAVDVRRAGRRDDALRAKVRLNAWILGGLVVAFYVGYIAWNFWSGPS